MNMKQSDEQKKPDMETILFLVFLNAMAIYYGWRMFALTPWYDELYTYYYFISRGPVYAAIHWPLPNNHVGYSVLSGFLNLFGNSAISLRGISWISSLVSIGILFAIGKKLFPKGFAMVPVFLFSAMGLVNQLAVQGRGYALATCLYLIALYELIMICQDGVEEKKHYVIFAIAVVWALYTLPSSVYFVIPLCVTGGMLLLIQKRNRELWQLVIAAAISAICTIALYAVIWLAIGSNLLSKTEGSSWYGQGHVSIILHAPFQALKTGISYMLATPYIQSVERNGYLTALGGWIRNLLNYYYGGLDVALIIVIVCGIGLLIYKMISHKEIRKSGMLEWFLLLSLLITPAMLIVQASLPYYRVFSYFGIPVALLITWILVQLFKVNKKVQIAYAATFLAGGLCIAILASPGSRAQYSDSDAAIEDILVQMKPEQDTKICVTDCDQEYLLKYMYNIETVQYDPDGADYALFNKAFVEAAENCGSVESEDAWKYYMSPDALSMDEIEKTMTVCYENDSFVLYKRK